VDPEARLLRVAARQYSVFTARQAVDAGLSKATIKLRVDRGLWLRLFRAVYVPSSVRIDWPQRAMGACLACGPSAVASFSSALAIWGLARDLGKPHVTIPEAEKRRCEGIIVHRALRLDVTTYERFRVTNPMRTLVDTASFVPEKKLARMLDDLHRRQLIDLDRFARFLEARRGPRVLRDLVEVRNPSRAMDSDFETDFLGALRDAGIPLPIPQYPVETANGMRYIDFAYPGQMLAIELDGRITHSTALAVASDRARQSELEDLGWHFRRFAWRKVNDDFPDVARTLRLALSAGSP
jgi:hypothetical protein